MWNMCIKKVKEGGNMTAHEMRYNEAKSKLNKETVKMLDILKEHCEGKCIDCQFGSMSEYCILDDYPALVSILGGNSR